MAIELKTDSISKLAFSARQPLVVDGVAHRTVALQRTGFQLALGYAYTDHFCQGSSFPLGEPWLIHLTPPPGAANDWDGRGILVSCTRNMAWGDIHMLAPLYRTAAEREAVIARFERAFSRSDEEEAEMERLADLARHTLAEDWDRLAAIYKLVPDDWTKPLAPAELQPLDLSKSPSEIQQEAQQYEEARGIWQGITA